MPTLSVRARLLAALSLTLLTVPPCAAQSTTGQITGVIADSSSAVVPGAAVVVTNVETGVLREATADEQGYYTVPLLQPGRYTITVRMEGFRTATRRDLVLNVDQTARVDFALEVGNVVETVEVRASAPLLQTQSGALGQVIESKQFEDLPLNNRGALGLIALSDNVVLGRGFNPGSFGGANQFSANGSRPGQNEILLDGAPNTLPGVWPGRGILGTPVQVDAVREVKVQTSAFSAEFGRTGGGLVNMVTKSGTNELHGSAFEFLRNSRLDANTYFNNRSNVPRGNFKRNQYGGTLGGPVILPGLYNGRNRTFYFGNFQGTRASEVATQVATVPTAAMRAGDFSDLRNAQGQPVMIYDPLTTTTGANPTRTVFAGNRIPLERIDPVGARLAASFPLPNQPGSVNNLVQSGANRLSQDLYGIRLDHVLTDSQQVYVRYSLTGEDSRSPDWFGNAARGFIGLDQRVHSVSTDYVHTITPTILLNLRYGFTDRTHENIDPAVGLDLTTLGFPEYYNSAAPIRVFPRVAATGYLALGNPEGINSFSYITHSAQQSVTMVRSAHTIKAGADARFPFVSQDRGVNASGNFSFTRVFTQGPVANRGGGTAGDAFASLLLGNPAGGDFGSALRAVSRNAYYGLYLQDDWRVTARLTLNLGLRYDLELPRTEADDRLDWFDFDAVSPLSGRVQSLGELRGGLRFAGADGNPRRHFDTDRNNFGPRAGFAYQPFRATVVRGGYGIFYGSGSIGAGGFNIASQGFAPSTSFVGSLDGLNPFNALRNPFPNGFNQPVGNSQGLLSLVGQNIARVYDRNAPLPYNQQWTLSVQQQFGNTLVQAAYTGSRGIHLGDGAGFDINQLRPEVLQLGSALQQLVPNPFFNIITAPGPLSNAMVSRGQLLRPYPHFGNLTVFNPAAAASTYHGFSVKAERRFASGLGFLASWTTSKNISDGPATIGPAAGHQNFYDRRADRSLAEEDISQRFTSSLSYELPFGANRPVGRNWGRWPNLFLGGWQVNMIASRQTGAPIPVTFTPNTSGSLGGLQRPNSTGLSAGTSGRVQDRLTGFLNAAAFSAPEPFTFGNVGRTLPDVRGPAFGDLSLSLFKSVGLTEKVRLQFRAEAFNATNSPMFGMPNSQFGSAAFGTINNQVNDPRQIQFALRLFF